MLLPLFVIFAYMGGWLHGRVAVQLGELHGSCFGTVWLFASLLLLLLVVLLLLVPCLVYICILGYMTLVIVLLGCLHGSCFSGVCLF